ncbi:hypothetical protein [Cylindrospermum sp. FACHB-282]|uniref:hypothetical protein n=1 Tax=Cylindrospermum sp. FACHB-282 TaxID=2692794 RepID=UPI0016875F89|nr:hypothetical protein [Cylindrospermum sp. FACHB-282]MBD2386043.1 hypothetical protein [Cylindrospermum sp. FACHB-282]
MARTRTRKQKPEKPFVVRQLKVIAGGRVQKTLGLCPETHEALAAESAKQNVWESHLAEKFIRKGLGLEPLQVPTPKSKHVENMGEHRRNKPKTDGLNTIPISANEPLSPETDIETRL